MTDVELLLLDMLSCIIFGPSGNMTTRGGLLICCYLCPCRYEELRYWYDCLCYEEELRQYHDYIAAVEEMEYQHHHHEVIVVQFRFNFTPIIQVF